MSRTLKKDKVRKVRTTISIDPDVLARLEEKARQDYGSNVSLAAQVLLDKSLK